MSCVDTYSSLSSQMDWDHEQSRPLLPLWSDIHDSEKDAELYRDEDERTTNSGDSDDDMTTAVSFYHHNPTSIYGQKEDEDWRSFLGCHTEASSSSVEEEEEEIELNGAKFSRSPLLDDFQLSTTEEQSTLQRSVITDTGTTNREPDENKALQSMGFNLQHHAQIVDMFQQLGILVYDKRLPKRRESLLTAPNNDSKPDKPGDRQRPFPSRSRSSASAQSTKVAAPFPFDSSLPLRQKYSRIKTHLTQRLSPKTDSTVSSSCDQINKQEFASAHRSLKEDYLRLCELEIKRLTSYNAQLEMRLTCLTEEVSDISSRYYCSVSGDMDDATRHKAGQFKSRARLQLSTDDLSPPKVDNPPAIEESATRTERFESDSVVEKSMRTDFSSIKRQRYQTRSLKKGRRQSYKSFCYED